MSKIQELKDKLAAARKKGQENDGKAVLASENGPAGFALVDSIILILESQQAEIQKLKSQLASFEIR